MTKNLRLARRWLIALLAAILLSGTAITLAYPATLAGLTGAAGSGYDPLTPSEQMRALQALQGAGAVAQGLQVPSDTALSAVTMGTTLMTDGVPQAPAEELLLIERHNEEKQVYAQGRWPRRADVYVYRYADDTLIHQVYNMDTNQVDTTEQVQGVQLPLTERESQRALAIALADPNVRPMLDAEYRSITQQELVAAEQLIVKAMTFHASSIPAEDVGSAAACGIKRCAQLLLAAGENVALQVIPVVDLSSGIVVNALPFNRAPR